MLMGQQRHPYRTASRHLLLLVELEGHLNYWRVLDRRSVLEDVMSLCDLCIR